MTTNPELDKWYEEDRRLQHLLLKDIFYLNEEAGGYAKANLDVFGHCSQLVDSHNGTTNGTTITTKRPRREILMSVQEDNNGFIVSIDDDQKYLMTKDKVDALANYLAVINKPYIDRRMAFKSEVLAQVNSLKHSSWATTIFYNYFTTVSPLYFMDEALIAGGELNIEEKNKKGKLLFITTEQQRNEIVHYTGQTEGTKTTIYTSSDNSDSLREYVNNHFDLLVKVVMNRHNLDYPLSLYATHVLLLETAIKFYSDLWNGEYGHLFLSLDGACLEELVQSYIRIDSIQHRDLVTAGKFAYFLMQSGKFQENANYISCSSLVFDKITKEHSDQQLLLYEQKLLNASCANKMSIEAIDLMSGKEFEQFVCSMFNRLGYATEMTKETGDQGIDVIAQKDQVRLGIQTKCYSGVVTNAAIQEVVAGIKHYHCDKAIVVTNNLFTKSAVELAQSNGVVLWDRNMLIQKITELY